MSTPDDDQVASALVADKDFISKLPDELKVQLFELLDTHGVASLRLVSRKWGIIGEEHLMKAGFIVPDIRGGGRLTEASNRPLIAKGIKTLILYIPDVNRRELDKLLRATVASRHARARRMRAIYAQLSPLDGDRVAGSRPEDPSPPGNYSPIFANLPNLDTIVVKSTSFADWHKEAIPSICHDLVPAECFALVVTRRRCTAILMSLNSLPTPIRKLVLDPLPISTFFLWAKWAKNSPQFSKESMTTLREGLAQLQDLTICVEQNGQILYEELGSFNRAKKPFGQFLKFTPQLRSLSFSFSRANQNSAAFSKTLLESHWPCLENLILSRVPCYWAELSAFLLRHKGTLKKLGVYKHMLIDLPPFEGLVVLDWEEVLTEIRENLSLESFSLQQFSRDTDLYQLSTCYDGTEHPDRVWERLPQDQQHGHMLSGAALLEKFVTGKMRWPMLNPAIRWTGYRHIWNVDREAFDETLSKNLCGYRKNKDRVKENYALNGLKLLSRPVFIVRVAIFKLLRN